MTDRHSVNCTRGVAGQVAYAITTTPAIGEPFTVTYTGSIYGAPGPIFMHVGVMDGFRFDDPERFGPTFDRAWIDAVLAAADDFTAQLLADD